ncbi:MAG: 16S rRNA processing protein RimM, partial [Clostridia bacterium]|nr:16S rRNA processing protein RimM [Clostridia bacterium]
MKKTYIECGRICTAHGVHGELKVEHWCDSPNVLTKHRLIYTKERDGSFTDSAVRRACAESLLVIMSVEGID